LACRESKREEISEKVLPMLFLVPALFSRRMTTSFFARESAVSRALIILTNPFSLPSPRWLPRWVIRYGMLSAWQRINSRERACTDFA
jgi:hypothetical protein